MAGLELPSFSFLYEYGGTSVELIVWSLFLGIVLASVGVMYNKQILGGFVRLLLARKALSPESALTLEEAGYGKNPFVRFSLRKKSTFRKIVASDDELHFYIPEEKALHASCMYEAKSNGLMGILIAIVMFAIVAFLSAMLLPLLLDLIGSMFGGGGA